MRKIEDEPGSPSDMGPLLDDRYEKLVAQLPVGVVVHGADGNVLRANAAAQQLFAVDEERLAGMKADDPSIRFLSEDGRPLAPENLPVFQVLKTLEPIQNFLIGIEWEGVPGVRWALLNVFPLMRNGLHQVIACSVDITAYREAERSREEMRAKAEREQQAHLAAMERERERQERLIAELDHRVKNNMATLIALLEISKRQDNFAESFTERVHAMGRVHEMLAQGTWSSVETHNIVGGMLWPFATAPRVVIEGPSLPLTPQVAQPLGLALHELITNACKYGSLSVPDGRVAVRWSLPGDDTVLLLWQEAGGPAVGELEQGTGMQLVRGLLEHELGGQADPSVNEEGLQWRLVFRAPKHPT